MNWNWINTIGLIIIVLMLIPNIIYAYQKKYIENKCKNKILNIFEQIGRYGSMLLMVFNFGIAEFAFWSKNGFVVWLISVPILILLYWIVWFMYFKVPKKGFAMVLAIIPSIIFVLSGVLLGHWLLVIFGAIFSVFHIITTHRNHAAIIGIIFSERQ